MQIIIADRNPNSRLALKLLIQNSDWKGLIIEIANAIELIKHLMVSQSSILFLDEQFMGNNTGLLIEQIKEINSKFSLIYTGKKNEISDQATESSTNYIVLEDGLFEKKDEVIQKIIDNYCKSMGKIPE